MKQIATINSIPSFTSIKIPIYINIHILKIFRQPDFTSGYIVFRVIRARNSSDRASILVQRSGTCANEKRFCKRADNLHWMFGEHDDLWAERNGFFDRRNRKNNSDGNEDLREFKKGILKMQNDVK